MATGPKIPHEEAPFSPPVALLTAIGATLLIVTEMLGAVFAFAYALSGLIGLGPTATWVVVAAFGLPGAYASALLTRRILKVETTLRVMAGQAA